VYQELRVYTVKHGAMDAWLSEWQQHVYPLRLKLGFSIPAAWVIDDESLFVWLLEYDGDDYAAANDAYYSSAARRAITPDPTRHLAATEHWPLRAIV
jgi:hypothetical protein